MSPTMADLISDFYRQNEWATLTLIEACRPLTDQQLDAAAVGTYGSIRNTLRHIVGAEIGYAIRLGATGMVRIERDDPWPGFDRLAELARTTAAALTRLAMEAADRKVRVDSSERPSDVDGAVILVQMVHHSTDHRSQINTILTTLGIEPPDLSAWSWGLADGRVTCGVCGSREHYGVDHP